MVNCGPSTSPSPTPAHSLCSHLKIATQHQSTRYFTLFIWISDWQTTGRTTETRIKQIIKCYHDNCVLVWTLKVSSCLLLRLIGVPVLPCWVRCWRRHSRMILLWSCSAHQRCQVEELLFMSPNPLINKSLPGRDRIESDMRCPVFACSPNACYISITSVIQIDLTQFLAGNCFSLHFWKVCFWLLFLLHLFPCSHFRGLLLWCGARPSAGRVDSLRGVFVCGVKSSVKQQLQRRIESEVLFVCALDFRAHVRVHDLWV